MSRTMSKSFWKTSGGIAGLLILFAIIIAVNVILGRVRVRADLTGEKLYTLSQGSRSILAKLEQPLTLKLFVSSSSPAMPPVLKNYARQVEDLLKEYVVASNGRIALEKYDPVPDSDAEEWAQKYGISGQPMDIFGPPVYFGLVAQMGDAEAAIPAFDPQAEELLEYTITRLIYRVCHPEKPVVGVISSLQVLGTRTPPFPMPGQPRPASQPPWLIFQDLRDDYTFRELQTSVERIDDDIKTLLLIHPKDLSDKTLYAIDQFVLRGGQLMALLDPLSVADMETSGGANPFGMSRTSSNLAKLLSAWGVTYDENKVVADMRAISRVRMGDGGRVEESPVWLSLSRSNTSARDILTSGIESIMLPYAGAFTAESTKELTVTPLVMSSESACLVNSFSAQLGASTVRSEFRSGGVPLALAVRLTGTFKTAFPEGAPKDVSGSDTNQPPSSSEEESLKEGRSTVILIADVDMIYDRFCVQEINFLGARAFQPLNDNAIFFANALEQAAGSADLVGIRSRGRFARPFEVVLKRQEKAMLQWQAKEKELEARLQETQSRLRELQTDKDPKQRFILSEQQKKAIESFREQEFQIKQDLKMVRKNLRQDIERLGMIVKTVNIAAMPALVVLGGIGFWMRRRSLKTLTRRDNRQ